MSHNKYLYEYQKQAVGTASPLQLVIMLYDGATKCMIEGRQAMLEKRIQDQNDSLQKAQKIIVELLTSLDMDQGGEIAKNLASLYKYVFNQLVEANIEDKVEKIDVAMKVMTELRSSWAEIEKTTKPAAQAGGDVNAAA
ncbi:MAG: flagellar export chaperone FliS [Armatimonadetes bacterium]|nr:flagellar export chaperone FliS [Armatimonadota bacterium]